MPLNLNYIKKFDMELTNKCNARCPGCTRTVDGDTHPFLKANQLQWTLDEFSSLLPPEVIDNKEFTFGGTVDDPLMNTNIVSIVEYILDNNGEVEIFTNTGANTKETFSKLGKLSKKTNRLRVTFSVDGLKDTNHLYRVNVKWEKVLENMKAYLQQKGKAKWEYLVFEHNIKDVDDAKKLANDLGVKLVLRQNIRNTHSWISKTKAKEEGKIVTKEFEVKPTKEYEHPEISKANELTGKSNVTKDEGRSIKCHLYHNKTVFVDWNQRVWPCCWWATDNFLGHEYFHMLTDKFGDKWNSLKHNSWNDILGHTYYSFLLRESWNGQSSEYYNSNCFKQCGDNASRQSYKKEQVN